MSEADRLAEQVLYVLDMFKDGEFQDSRQCDGAKNAIAVEDLASALAAYDSAKEVREAEREYLSWIYELASCETCVDADEERYQNAMTQAPIALGRLLAARAKVDHGGAGDLSKERP